MPPLRSLLALIAPLLALGIAAPAQTPTPSPNPSPSPAPASSPTPRLALEVETGVQTPIGALVRDPSSGQVWDNTQGAWVAAPAPPFPSGFIAECLVPLTVANPFPGISGTTVALPGAPNGPLSIYLFNAPVNEVFNLTCNASAGTFDLTGPGGKAPGIPFNAAPAQLQPAFDAAFGVGNTLVTGGPLPAAVTVTCQGALASKTIPLPTLANGNLTGGAAKAQMVTLGQPLTKLSNGLASGYAVMPGGSAAPTQQIININALPATAK